MNQKHQTTIESKPFIKKLALAVSFYTMIFVLLAPAQQNRFVLSGDVKDQNGAVIVNAEVMLSNENGTVQTTVSDKQGAFRFKRLENGIHSLRISAASFNTHEENLDLSIAAKPLQLSVILYPTIKANVEVDVSSETGLNAEQAAGTLVLTEQDLNALPDDPEDLRRQLQNLAAASGSAPETATITVDNFRTGGNMPPKSAIRAVRINPNLYSAEYDTPPFQGGRIEISTKPGSGSLTGSTFFNYNPTSFNARDPFALTRAPMSTKRYGMSLGAPIIKKRAGFFLDFEKRDISDAATVNAIVLDDNFGSSNFIRNVPAPKQLFIGSARADWQANAAHTLIFRYDLNRNNLENEGVGGVNLPERGFNNRQTENSFRLSETTVINPRSVNELRVGLTFNRIEQQAVDSAPAIIVAGSFSSGGANLQKLSRDEQRLELLDYLTTDAGKHNLKFGVQIYNRRIGELRAENTNGTFFFGGSIINRTTQISSLEQFRRTLLNLPGGAPTRFSTTIGAPRVSINQWLFAGFVQDEWRLNPKILISLGLRYEAQTAPNDLASLAPRFGIAYTPNKKQNWVFRARGGVYYERFEEALGLETERLDGSKQQQIIVDLPTFPNPFAFANANRAVPTIRIFDSNLRPPASLQMRLEIERQLRHGWKISATHSWTIGWNRLRSRNINAPIINAEIFNPQLALRPNGIAENILQFESSGRAQGRVLYLGVNQNSNKFFRVNAGYINFDFRTDADNAFALPQSSYDFAGEWARPVWQIRHRLFLTATVNLPYKLSLLTSLNAASGAPYNITTGRDNNGDGNFNDRPSLSETTDLGTIQTGFGFLNPNAVNGNLRRNAGTNPAIATLDLNMSRAFVLGKRNVKGESRYRLIINVRAANALNRANLLQTVGVLSSPLFGRATTANSARRVEFGLRFNF